MRRKRLSTLYSPLGALRRCAASPRRAEALPAGGVVAQVQPQHGRHQPQHVLRAGRAVGREHCSHTGQQRQGGQRQLSRPRSAGWAYHEALWQVFGSYTSHAWHDAPSYYGSGECFVFELRDGQLKMYTWSGKNSLFMLSNAESFAIGGG